MGMARFVLVLLLALVSLPRPEAVSFYLVVPGDPEYQQATQAAQFAVDYWNGERLSDVALTIREIVSAERMNGEVELYNLMLDVEGGSGKGAFVCQVYKEDGSWRVLLPTPLKNSKATFPETRTGSINDVWSKKLASDPDAVLIVNRTNTAILAHRDLQALSDKDPAKPIKIDKVLHVEMRRRDLGQEMQILRSGKDTARQQQSDAKIKYRQSQDELIEKLSFKKMQVEEGAPDKLLLQAVDLEIEELGKKIKATQETDKRSGEQVARLQRAETQLEAQVTAQREVAAAHGIKAEYNTYYFFIIRYEYETTELTKRYFRRQALAFRDHHGEFKLVKSMGA